MAYQNALISENIKTELQNLTSELLTTETVELDVLNSNLSMFQNTIESVCTPLFKKDVVNKNDCCNIESKQPWYNEECKLKRNVFFITVLVIID